MGSGFSHVSWS